MSGKKHHLPPNRGGHGHRHNKEPEVTIINGNGGRPIVRAADADIAAELDATGADVVHYGHAAVEGEGYQPALRKADRTDKRTIGDELGGPQVRAAIEKLFAVTGWGTQLLELPVRYDNGQRAAQKVLNEIKGTIRSEVQIALDDPRTAGLADERRIAQRYLERTKPIAIAQ